MKKILNKVKSIIFYLIVAVLTVFIFLELFIPDNTIKVFGFKSYVVVTQSMEPVIDVFDLVVDKKTDVEELEVGDIITFRVDTDYDGEEDVVTHYIAAIIENPDTGALTFKTHRHFEDENDLYQDPWAISSDDVLGEYWFHIPKLGYVVEFVKSPFGIAIIFLNVIVIAGIVYLIKKKDVLEESENKEAINENNELLEEVNQEEVMIDSKSEPEPVVEEKSQKKDLSKLTVTELKTLCKVYSISGYSKLKKTELISELEKHIK